MKNLRLPFMILFLFILPFSFCISQDLSKYYNHHAQAEGDLYFIYPFDAYANVADGTDFIFDITYRQGYDSATINFTYFTSSPDIADSMVIENGKNVIAAKTSKIYQDFKKHKWENRFTIKVPFEELEGVINYKSVPTIRLISQEKQMEYRVKEKKWESYADALNKILYIIKSQ